MVEEPVGESFESALHAIAQVFAHAPALIDGLFVIDVE
jgi:hypothetical protein